LVVVTVDLVVLDPLLLPALLQMQIQTPAGVEAGAAPILQAIKGGDPDHLVLLFFVMLKPLPLLMAFMFLQTQDN
jgi:hypothetical protein